jgi:hypothetical protein
MVQIDPHYQSFRCGKHDKSHVDTRHVENVGQMVAGIIGQSTRQRHVKTERKTISSWKPGTLWTSAYADRCTEQEPLLLNVRLLNLGCAPVPARGQQLWVVRLRGDLLTLDGPLDVSTLRLGVLGNLSTWPCIAPDSVRGYCSTRPQGPRAPRSSAL